MTPAAGQQQVDRQWEENYGTQPQPESQMGDPSQSGAPGPRSMEQDSMRQESMGRGPIEDDSAMGQDHARTLAMTRCRREVRCDQIGMGRKYPSMEECQTVLMADAQKELAKCPSGTNRAKVQECATAIDTRDCRAPSDHLTEIDECQTVSLCM